MCKGMKYNLQFKTGKNKYITINDLTMTELIKTIKEHYLKYYDIDNVNVSNLVIYNSMNRPNMCSKLIKNFCVISKC